MDLREAALGSGPRHPWERARLRALQAILAPEPLPASPALLDIGCGDGWVLTELARHLGAREAVGVDTALAAAPAAIAPSVPPAPTAPAERTGDVPIRTVVRLADVPARARFDLVLLLDVLEHVDDDRALLAEAGRRLAPGGCLLATVPAHPGLYGAHDRFLEHRRRYRPAALVRLATQAGLQVCGHGGLFASLLLPRAASLALERVGARRRPPTGVARWRHGPALTGLLTAALRLDNGLCLALARRGLPLPGLSAWVLCRRAPDRPGAVTGPLCSGGPTR